MYIEQQIKIRIVYKSGYTHDFYVVSFTVDRGNWNWTACGATNKPVLIGVDEIAAVYQVGKRYRLKFGAN